jgi:hypothetical protein
MINIEKRCLGAVLMGLALSGPAIAQMGHRPIDNAVVNCADDQVATGRFFFATGLRGDLDLRASAWEVATACQRPVGDWIRDCEHRFSATRLCENVLLDMTGARVQMGWKHRDNLKAWRKTSQKY